MRQKGQVIKQLTSQEWLDKGIYYTSRHCWLYTWTAVHMDCWVHMLGTLLCTHALLGFQASITGCTHGLLGFQASITDFVSTVSCIYLLPNN